MTTNATNVRMPALAAPPLRADDPSTFGFFQVEPDVAERGVWVTERIVVPAVLSSNSAVEIKGLYFPKLIARQSGGAESRLRVVLQGREVQAVQLRNHGEFRVAFSTPEFHAGECDSLVIECDRSFVPKDIGTGTDARKLSWRITQVTIGGCAVFDCRRPYNYIACHGAISGADQDARRAALARASLHAHLDAPQPGADALDGASLIVSGWAVNVHTGMAANVRIFVGDRVHLPHRTERQDVQQALASVFKVQTMTGFSATLAPPRAVDRIRVEVQADDGRWLPFSEGLLFSAPVNVSARHSRDGRWYRYASPTVLTGRTLDFLRGGPIEGHEPVDTNAIRFHLDTPSAEPVTVLADACLVSGWAVYLETRKPARVRILVGAAVHNPHPKPREDVQRAFGAEAELPLETGFACVLMLPMGVHRMSVEILGRDGNWVSVRRALLLRVPGVGRKSRPTPKLSYSAWTRQEKKRLARELPEIQRHIDVMPHKPVFTFVVDTRRGKEGMERTLRSIRGQIYPYSNVQWLGADGLSPHAGSRATEPAAGRTTALPATNQDFIVFLQCGQCVAANALYEFANVVNQSPDVDLVYADEDTYSTWQRRLNPFYKPAWSPDYFETFNYLGFAACFRSMLAARCIDTIESFHAYDFALRFTEATSRIKHVGQVLGHRREATGTQPASNADATSDIAALSARLERTGRIGSVGQHQRHRGCYQIAIELQREPLVSIVIPTAGKTVTVDGRQIDLLCNIVEQIKERSTYKNIEIIIIDNDDLKQEQVAVLAAHGCRRITYKEPIFNIAKKLNLGATIAKGSILLLMNDDIEILTPSWIERLLEHFEKPHVGVVGAKLLYPDLKTQHVGVVHNAGNPDHVRRLYPRDDAGYFFSTCGVRNYMAVTGACMMTPAAVYRQVGGYSEPLAISYNDADYCLKVRALGLSVVYAPGAELIHMESQSRVASADLTEVAWYHRRWAADTVSDIYYNERFLTVASPTFVPTVNQRLL